jgi:putative ATPase
MELPFQEPPAPPLAERLRPRTHRRDDRPAAPARGRQAAAGRVRIGPAALDDPVGSAGRSARRPWRASSRRASTPVHRDLGGAGGVKDIREAVERAQARNRKAVARRLRRRGAPLQQGQQDAFLPHVESGLFTFIGATTENPSFEVNSALLSRGDCARAEPLDDADLGILLDRAADLLAAPALTDAARKRLIGYADGDARRLLNAYENLIAMVGEQAGAAAGRGRADRRGNAGACARRAAAPLRQGRRAVLRHHFGTAQGGARQRPGRRAVLVRADARRRRRPALRGAPDRPDGERGHRPRRPARAAHRARRGRGLRAPRLPEGELALAEAVVYSPSHRRATRSTTRTRRPRASCATTARVRCRCGCAMRRPR